MKRRKAKRNPAPVFVTPAALVFVSQRKPGAATVGDLIELADGSLARIESIDVKTRSIRARPIAGATARGLDKARNAFRAFTGMEPREVIETTSGNAPRIAWKLGDMLEVMYETTRDGKREKYLHPFKKSARPVLAVDAETGQLVLVGGAYTVTERGITDH